MTDLWFYVDTDDDGLMESTDLDVSGRVAGLESVHEALYGDLLALERFGGDMTDDETVASSGKPAIGD